jgi:hypothetical protein
MLMQFLSMGVFVFQQIMQLEWVAACYAMADLCQKDGAAVAEKAAFALLEANPMIIDTLIILMTNTPYVGPEDHAKAVMFAQYNEARYQLTPDQDYSAYIKLMKTAPLFLLDSINKCVFGPAVFAKMKESAVYYLLVQRFLRVIAREGMGTDDGKELGPICRRILPNLCKGLLTDGIQDLLKKGPLSEEVGTGLLAKTGEFEADTLRPTFNVVFNELTRGKAAVSNLIARLGSAPRKKSAIQQQTTNEEVKQS